MQLTKELENLSFWKKLSFFDKNIENINFPIVVVKNVMIIYVNLKSRNILYSLHCLHSKCTTVMEINVNVSITLYTDQFRGFG